MNVNFSTLGCRLNEAETESWAEQFHSNGDRIVASPEQADLIVLNTCAVTTQAERKSRQMIRRLHRANPAAKLVVSGCYATLERDKVAAELGVDWVVANADKDQLVNQIKLNLIPDATTAGATHPGQVSLFAHGRQRAFIKVQDGCRYRCTFCIVTLARGQEKSRPVRDIVDQINVLNHEGIQEIVLTGVHLGGYGSDIGSDLVTLIENILDHTEIPRIRFGSLEPWDLPPTFFRLFRNPRLMPHLHLPLQSGCDNVLRRMARRCKVADFMRLADQARNTVEDMNLTTDVIVGFPGETDREWQESLSTIENVGFGHLHIFPFSARSGTKAAQLSDPVTQSEIKKRCRVLHQLGASMKRATYQRHLGRTFPVLWERAEASGEPPANRISGYTPNYLRVSVVDEFGGLENTIRPVRLTSIDDSLRSMQGSIDRGRETNHASTF